MRSIYIVPIVWCGWCAMWREGWRRKYAFFYMLCSSRAEARARIIIHICSSGWCAGVVGIVEFRFFGRNFGKIFLFRRSGIAREGRHIEKLKRNNNNDNNHHRYLLRRTPLEENINSHLYWIPELGFIRLFSMQCTRLRVCNTLYSLGPISLSALYSYRKCKNG